LKGTALEASCVSPNEPCEDTKYRSIDGSCNNFFGPFWGQSGTSFTRFVPPQYGDGNHLTEIYNDIKVLVLVTYNNNNYYFLNQELVLFVRQVMVLNYQILVMPLIL